MCYYPILKGFWVTVKSESHPALCLTLSWNLHEFWVIMTITYNHYLWKPAWGHAGLQRESERTVSSIWGVANLIFKCVFPWYLFFSGVRIAYVTSLQISYSLVFPLREDGDHSVVPEKPIFIRNLEAIALPTHCWSQGSHLMNLGLGIVFPSVRYLTLFGWISKSTFHIPLL